jgi:hypothetical protein
MQHQLLACSNCDQGAADHYWWLVGAALVASVVVVALLLVRLRHAGIWLRAVGALAVIIVGLGAGLSLSTFTQPTQARTGGLSVSCGSALTAANTTGVPNDAALDPEQLACHRAGRQHLRERLPTASSVLVVGFLTAATSIAASRKRRRELIPA